MRNVLTNTKNVVLPYNGDASRFNHMLRLADRNVVNDFVSYLFDTCKEVYLGGGVVEGWINNGNRNYGDIDLIAIPKSYEAEDFVVSQIREGCPDKNYSLDFAEEDLKLGRKAHLFGVAKPIVLGNREFKPVDMTIQQQTMEQVYMSGPITHRFGLLPKATLSEIVFGMPSVIDVSILNPRQRI
ncbi:MAG TPA: hypothetical protein VHA12_03280 [Candidatus Nanoarchaeia archaeon]|nr:hypothetical protein [Candidatus Nanoarchaeia archaeon]